MRLASLDLFAKTDEKVRERTILGGLITAACVAVLALSVVDEFALMRTVERSTHFSAYTSRERRSRMHVHLEVWFPSLRCDDVVVDVTDGSGSQAAHLSGAQLSMQRTDTVGSPLDAAPQRVGPSEMPSSGMRLRHKIDSLARALHEISVARACSGSCVVDWTQLCPNHWTIAQHAGSGGCIAPFWYPGPCASSMRFASVERALIAEMVDECEVDWPCNRVSRTGRAAKTAETEAAQREDEEGEGRANSELALGEDELLHGLRLALRALRVLIRGLDSDQPHASPAGMLERQGGGAAAAAAAPSLQPSQQPSQQPSHSQQQQQEQQQQQQPLLAAAAERAGPSVAAGASSSAAATGLTESGLTESGAKATDDSQGTARAPTEGVSGPAQGASKLRLTGSDSAAPSADAALPLANAGASPLPAAVPQATFSGSGGEASAPQGGTPAVPAAAAATAAPTSALAADAPLKGTSAAPAAAAAATATSSAASAAPVAAAPDAPTGRRLLSEPGGNLEGGALQVPIRVESAAVGSGPDGGDGGAARGALGLSAAPSEPSQAAGQAIASLDMQARSQAPRPPLPPASKAALRVLASVLKRLLRSPLLALGAEDAAAVRALYGVVVADGGARLGGGAALRRTGGGRAAAAIDQRSADRSEPAQAEARALLLAALRGLQSAHARHAAEQASRLRCVLTSAERLGAHLQAAARESEGADEEEAAAARAALQGLAQAAQRALHATNATALALARNTAGGLRADGDVADGGAEEAKAEAVEDDEEEGAQGLLPLFPRFSSLEDSVVRWLRATERTLRAQPREGCALRGTLTVPFAPGRVSISPGYRRGVVRASRAHHAVMRGPVRSSSLQPGAARARRESLASGWWNATHVVRRLSFGVPFPGQRAPLERAAFVAAVPSDVRYGLTVVPTEYAFKERRSAPEEASVSFEYSATRHVHELGADSAHDRLPGVHLSYEISPLRLRVIESFRYTAGNFAWRVLSIGSNLFVVGHIVDKVLHLALRLRLSRRQAQHGTHELVSETP